MAIRCDGSAWLTGRNVPQFVLRCAALMVVVLSLFPVCADSAGEAFPPSGGTAMAAVHVPQGWGGAPVAGHLCPAPGHVQCRPGEPLAANVPSSQAAGQDRRAAVVVDATWAPLAQKSCRTVASCKRVRSIEELQVQRT